MYALLFQPLDSLSGVGATLKQRLLLRGVGCVGDLLLHLPRDYVDDRKIESMINLREGVSARIQGRILRRSSHGVGAKKQVSLLLEDGTGTVHLSFFHAAYMMRDARLQEGRLLAVRGVPQYWGKKCQMVHPDWSLLEQFQPRFHPVYGMLAGLSGKRLAGFIQQALTMLRAAQPSPLDGSVGSSFQQALQELHQPREVGSLAFYQAQRRVKSEELLVYLRMMQEQRRSAALPATIFAHGILAQRLLASLPFALTDGQQAAWLDIQQDLRSGERMHRLIQGDVGSGKTWVAALAITQVLVDGGQVALMAPTEVLAKQHEQTLQPLLHPLGIRMALLTGSTPAAKRRKITAALADGSLHLVMGTHALISDDVHYHQLSLAIVDEQHRFGVKQRWALTEKIRVEQSAVHLLAMTATPIPRSLAMALYGDMNLSVMRGMPIGRKTVETRVFAEKSLTKLAAGMRRLLNEAGRIYWIVPRIEESEEDVLGISVGERSELLRQHFPEAGVLGLHGRMKAKEKQENLTAFAQGACTLLVSTTVVEVGVNVPEARLIVIEHADQYGLAQLHQLRGRVGRSNEQGYCMLLPSPEASEKALQRLALMVKHHDGLELAEMDLQLRGAGDAIGTRQSGEAGFRLLNLAEDGALVQQWHEQMPEVMLDDAMIRFWRPMVEAID